MQRISSNATLFWKIFFPTFWFSFYGIFTIVLWAYSGEEQGVIFEKNFRWGLTTFYVLGSFIIYFTVLQLKRVEYEDDYFYITNYFRTIRIPMALVRHIDIQNYYIFKQAKIYLKSETPFGKSISFIMAWNLVQDLLKEKPGLFDKNHHNETIK